MSGLAMLGMLGCKTYDVIPDNLEPQLATGLTYETVQNAPNDHQGKLVAWGGEVLAAERTQKGTRLELLHLPLTDALHPTEERARSKGRFIAFDNEGTITDPAMIKPGTPVTIIGKIGPELHEELQGVDYQYPRLDVVDMTVWERKVMKGWRRWGPFGSVTYDPTPWTRYRSYRVD
ncbi:MAG: Slp family lipoprotein [Nitrospira sp.]